MAPTLTSRRPAALVGVVLALLATLLAVAPASQAAETVTWKGAVHNAAGYPVASLTIELREAESAAWQPPAQTVRSAQDGSFTFTFPRSKQEYRIQATDVRRFETAYYEKTTTKAFAATQSRTFPLTVRTQNLGSVEGTVYATYQGQRIRADGISASLYLITPEGREWFSRGNQLGDDEPNGFRFVGLPPGTYQLSFDDLFIHRSAANSDGVRPYLRYPGWCWGVQTPTPFRSETPVCSEAPTFTVKPNRTTLIGRSDAPGHLVNVSGRVTTTGGRPLASQEVDLRLSTAAKPRETVRTDSSGRWQASVFYTLPDREMRFKVSVDTAAGEFWYGGTDQASATVLKTTLGTSTTGVDIVVPNGAAR